MKQPYFEQLATTGVRAAEAAGEILHSASRHNLAVLKDSARDIKSEADIKSNQVICSILLETDIPIISEESENSLNPLEQELVWIVDPLDGTVNFVKEAPLCCTSIGLWGHGNPILGVIHDFNTKETIWGGPQFGSFLNKAQLAVSSNQKPENSIIATGFPNGRSFTSSDLLEFVSKVQIFKKVRLLGSAALSLAWIAQGKYDAYMEEDIHLWDVAAGLPLILGAGGFAKWSKIDLTTMKLTVAAASTETLLNKLL
jgi:myo-inositol-1(or 4)-monophosphatase